MKQESAGNEPQFQSRIVIDSIIGEATPQGKRFKRLLLEAVEESLSTLGETPKQAVYYHLREAFRIERQEIPDKIDEFAFAIERIFGQGAKILEIQIMKSLHEKTGDAPKQYLKKEELSFTEYLRAHVAV
jgi:hypothetical protein